MSISENPNILRFENDALMLWRAGESVPQPVDEVRELPANTVFAAPGDRVRLTAADVRPEEVRHLVKSLPFLLEEDVIDDVDSLHFAYRQSDQGAWPVAVIRKAEMEAWQEALGEDFSGDWCPEPLMLPYQEGDVCLVIEAGRAIIRLGEFAGTTIEKSLVVPLLSGLPEAPQRIVLYGTDELADLELIPQSLAHRVQWRQGSFGSGLLLVDNRQIPLDLRQGAFAPQLPLARWWETWRQVAIVAGVTVILALGSDIAQIQRLKAENLALRSAIQASYRLANPRGAVVDVEKQLDRQLAEFNPAGTGVAFTPLLATVAGAVAEDTGISISSINFSASTGEVRVDLLAADYAAIESLRGRLDGKGLTATMETSSSRDEQVRARLRVEAGV